MSVLRPCPWCATTNLHVGIWGNGCRVFHDIWDAGCDAGGPVADTEEAAIAAWNRRVPAPPETPHD